MKNLILSIDQGTTGSTALLMDLKGKVVGSHNEPFKQIFPKPGWVEHNPNDILKSVKTALKKVLEKTKKNPKNIFTIGITNQRETVVFWDGKTGKPYGNAIVWQCRRTSKRTEQIQKTSFSKTISKKTGLSVDPYFSSTKMEWFLKNNKDYKKNIKDLKIGTIDSFLIWNLTKRESFYTEPSNASRTQLFNLKTQTWDKDLLKYFKISEDFLPEVLDSNAEFGMVKGFAPLIDGTPITGVLGDQQSALYGQGALKAGDVKCTFGTGSFILLNTGEAIKASKNGLLTTVAWRLKGQKPVYALEGGAFNCSSCINWFKDELGVITKSSEIGEKAFSVKNSNGVQFAPTFSGVGAPYWSPDSRGAFIGLTRGATGAHMSRALLEGLSFQNTLIFQAMKKDFGKALKSIYVDGGASQSNEFMKIQSAFSGQTLVRPKNIETTAMGAAYIAGLGSGVFSKASNPVDKKFQMNPSKEEKELIKQYDILFKAICKPPFLSEGR